MERKQFDFPGRNIVGIVFGVIYIFLTICIFVPSLRHGWIQTAAIAGDLVMVYCIYAIIRKWGLWERFPVLIGLLGLGVMMTCIAFTPIQTPI